MSATQHPAIVWLKGIRDFFNVSSNTLANLTVDDLKNFPSTYWSFLTTQWQENTLHVIIETGLFGFIVWLMFLRKTTNPKEKSKKLTPEAEKERFNDFVNRRDNLVPQLTPAQNLILSNFNTITAVKDFGKRLDVQMNDPSSKNGVKEVKDVLNMSSFDFFGMGSNPEVKQVARQALEKYGCGSCGPRGFYGTIDQHLEFEIEIAKFYNIDEAISYSDGSSSITSAIPAFSKKGDLLIIDDACNESICAGAYLSRSTVIYFKHNDMDDLRSKLQKVKEDDQNKKRDSTQQRRFIVVEGLYRNTGNLVKLPELKKIKEEFFYRVILDETLSFGTLGKTGKGVCEHFGMDIKDFEIVNIAMDTALGSIGGVCLGSREIVDHQRLSGAGYCFSASAPPFLSASAMKALDLIKTHGAELREKLRKNADVLGECLSQIESQSKGKLTNLNKDSKFKPPVQCLALSDSSLSRADEITLIAALERECVSMKLGISSCKYAFQKADLKPALRFTVSSLLNENEIKDVTKIVISAWEKVSKK
jgi:serine palmitoyltransferase